MDAAPLLSVIVPIYNVEKYVRKCLEGLRGQTMREIEVICIDDGSTDGSGRIADEYESGEFPVFRVIHTKNRGLSAARNRGIDEARSEWLMFVDSDDWVEPGFCEIPYEAAIENGADMVIFEAWRTTQSERVKRERPPRIQSGIVNAENVILNCCVWNKLYAKRLFEEIRYPEGHVFEDISTTHKLIHLARKIYRCEDRLYYHRKRKDSISNSSSSWADSYCARKQRYKDLISLEYPEKKVEASIQMAALSYCGQASSKKDPLYEEAVEIVKNIKEIPEGFNSKQRNKLLVWRMNKSLYRWV